MGFSQQHQKLPNIPKNRCYKQPGCCSALLLDGDRTHGLSVACFFPNNSCDLNDQHTVGLFVCGFTGKEKTVPGSIERKGTTSLDRGEPRCVSFFMSNAVIQKERPSKGCTVPCARNPWNGGSHLAGLRPSVQQ